MATRPSRLQSRNRPIFLFLSVSNFDLKLFTDFADTVSWSSIFQRLTTLSEWRRTSQLQWCLTSLNEWLRVLLSVFNSKNLVNGIGERFFAILKTSMRSEQFLLSPRVHRFSLGIPCMCTGNCWLLSLAYYRIVTYTLTKCHGVHCSLPSGITTKVLKNCKTFSSRPRPRPADVQDTSAELS